MRKYLFFNIGADEKEFNKIGKSLWISTEYESNI